MAEYNTQEAEISSRIAALDTPVSGAPDIKFSSDLGAGMPDLDTLMAKLRNMSAGERAELVNQISGMGLTSPSGRPMTTLSGNKRDILLQTLRNKKQQLLLKRTNRQAVEKMKQRMADKLAKKTANSAVEQHSMEAPLVDGAHCAETPSANDLSTIGDTAASQQEGTATALSSGTETCNSSIDVTIREDSDPPQLLDTATEPHDLNNSTIDANTEISEN